MRINWIFADGYHLDPGRDPDQIKSIGPAWGSWRTWRSCGTDNVICHDFGKARELVSRAFHAVCNFYVPNKHFADLGRPIGARLYEGEFKHDLDHLEDIVAMHLVSTTSDIVLLVGFDLKPIPVDLDQHGLIKIKNYYGLVRSIIAADPAVQWVLVDHSNSIDPVFGDLPNLTCDEFDNVLKLLI
jgi:hypothetical protein